MTAGMGPYAVMRSRPVLSMGRFEVGAIEPADIELIRQWRNDQMDVLRQSRPITAQEQEAYFARAIWPDKAADQPSNILLGIYDQGQLVGYGGLVHILWDYSRAEISFLLASDIAEDTSLVAELFAAWVRLMQQLAFEDLGLSRLTTETYAMRQMHIRLLEEAGFQREGLLRQHVIVHGQAMDAVVHGCLYSDLKATP